MIKRIAFVMLVCVCSVVLCGKEDKTFKEPFPPVDPAEVGIEAADLRVFPEQIRKWVEEEKVIGAVLHIIKSRRTVLHEAFGMRDREKEQPMEKDTICRLRSMTKPFVGTSVLMLMEQGKLRLADKISRYIPAYDTEECRDITVKQLLTHTGGFKQPGYPGGAFMYPSLVKLVERIGEVGPTHEPGSRYFYSDAGSSTLAHLAAVISGTPAETYIQTKILDRIGAADTFCNLTTDDPRRAKVSSTYQARGDKWFRYWENTRPQQLRYFRGSGGMYATTTDYARFLAAWMDEGRIGDDRLLEPETTRMALTASELSRSDNRGYGFQWEVYDIERGIFGHRGSDGTMAIASPRDDLMFLYFTQSRGNTTLQTMFDLFTNTF